MNEEFCACPGLGYSPATMVSGWRHSYGEPPGWLSIPGRQVVLTHQGRTAIGLLCEALALGQSDEVLLPAYNCGAEVDPFVHAGCRVVLYRIDKEAKIDVADIRSRLSKATKLVYVTHYFGWPQDIAELAGVCQQRGVLLVEDCAQALFSGGNDRVIGTLGDAVIYSFVKSLALPDGGALVLKQNLLPPIKEMRFPKASCISKASLPLFKRWIIQNHAPWLRHRLGRQLLNRSWMSKADNGNRRGRSAMLSSNCYTESRKSWRTSRVSMGILSLTDVQEVVARRRRNFACLQEQLDNREHLVPLHDSLPRDVCPLAYPIYAKEARYARQYLDAKGILIQGWPGYYPGMPWDEFPEACTLKDSLLGLPVHQDLSMAQMEYIARCSNSLGRSSATDEKSSANQESHR